MLVFDKNKQYENLISNGFEKYPNKRDLIILCEHWLSNGSCIEDLKELMIDFCLKYNSQFNYAKSENLILSVVKYIEDSANKENKFNFCEKIKIYSTEIEEIEKINDLDLQKIAFVMVCLAKWRNVDFIYLNVGSSIKMKDICDLAMVKATKKNQNLFLYKLNLYKFLDIKLRPLLKCFIPCITNSGKIAFECKINDNIIDFWETRHATRCLNCGNVFEKQGNKQKYCKECAKIVKNRQNQAYKRKIESEQMF